MAKSREFIVQIGLDGRLPMIMAKTIADLVAKVPGKKIKIVISLYRKRRSNNQNSFYFGCVVPLIRQKFLDSGNDLTADETHEFIKKFVWRHIKTVTLPNGEKKEVTDTSTKLTTLDWEMNIEKTRAWAAEFDLSIPFPNE